MNGVAARPVLTSAILLAVACGMVLGLLALTDPSELLVSLAKARPGPLAAAACLHLLGSVLRAARLQRLLDRAVPFLRVFLVANTGNMLNSLVPLRAGEFCMAFLFSRDLPGGGGEALAKVFADRVLDLVAVTLLFIAAALFFPPASAAGPGLAKAAAACAVALLAAAPLLFVFTRFRGPTLGVLLRPGPCLRLVAASLGIWIVIAGSLHFCMAALFPPPSLTASILAMSFTVVGLLAMTTPAGIGTTHGAIVIALRLCGVPLEQGLAFALLYHALATSLNVLLGLVNARFLGFRLSGLLRLAARRSAPCNGEEAAGRAADGRAIPGADQDL